MKHYKLCSKKVVRRRYQYSKSRGARYILQLECGHVVTRKASGNGGTCRKANCEKCYQERLKAGV